jgi:signal transduction histidine kinase
MESGGLLVAFERRLSLLLLGLLVALGAVLALVILVRRERRGRAVLMEARRREVESREAERLRLARELHDGPVQLLHLAGLNLASVEGSPGADPREDVAEAVRELRTIAEGLRPPALGPFGLAPALEDLATRFREKHPSIDLDVQVDAETGHLGESARLAIFRVAQEALSNSAAHSSATKVKLRFAADARDVELVVEDDGRGGAAVDSFVFGRSGRFGLLGMRERAQLLGGTLELHSPPGRGTRVRLRVKRASLEGAAHDPAGASA